MARIDVEAARAYFSHPSQQEFGLTEKDLPDWVEYRAAGGVCLAFHPAPMPDVWFCHIGVKPQAWGSIDEPVTYLLREFSGEKRCDRIVAWIHEEKRHAVALAARTGWKVDGVMPLGGKAVIMIGWAE